MQDISSFIDLHRLELTLAIGVMALVLLLIVAWRLRTSKTTNAQGRKTHRQSAGVSGYDGPIPDDDDSEFTEFNLFGKEKGGPKGYKDWD